ncbi:hypothetical protein BGW38_008569 [Lunasporangiospora selenospora]|uniref:Uncharacterized protein n=1 Tax=Lunasporangiospora selenospora TaxID=979761 RepID=A0A9P6K922_9FUNG|nr:hypothetical protein BGW38_008569 [Lunasporangiospora selenospora]
MATPTASSTPSRTITAEVAHVGHPFVEGKIEPEPFHQQGPPPPPPPSSFLPFNTPTTVASPYNPMAITPSEAPIAYSPQQQFSGAYPLYSAPPPPVYPASTRPVSSQEATGITRSPSPQVAFTPVSPSGSDTLYQASPQEYTISRNNPQDRTTPSHEVMADSYVGPEPNFRDAAWQQQDGSAAFYAPPPPPSSSSPQTLPPGAPQSLPPRVPHAMPPGAPQQRTSPSLPSSPSSMSSVPSAGVAAENKADLARRQKDLMQQQHLLDMERLRLEHELQLRRLDDESNME